MKIPILNYLLQIAFCGLMAISMNTPAKPTFGESEILLRCNFAFLPRESTASNSMIIILNTTTRTVHRRGEKYPPNILEIEGFSWQTRVWNDFEVIFWKQYRDGVRTEKRIDRKTGRLTGWDDWHGKQREAYAGQCSRLEESDMLF